MEFILYSSIKMICGIGISIIINAAHCKNIGYLLPYSAFASTDGAISFQQFTKIVFSKSCFTLFQALIIHSKALNHIFLQNSGCPYTELGCLNGVYSVTYGNNDIQIVIIGRNTAVGMIDIPTEQKILAMMEEMQTNPQDFRFVA